MSDKRSNPTATEHLDRIEDFIITYACHTPALESLAALRASIAEMERQNKFVHACAVQAHSEWLLQLEQPVGADALKASYTRWINQEEWIAALTVERDNWRVGATNLEAVLATKFEEADRLTVERNQARAALREIDRICAIPGISSSTPRVMTIADIARAALSSTTPHQTGSPSIPTPSVEAEANRESGSLLPLITALEGSESLS